MRKTTYWPRHDDPHARIYAHWLQWPAWQVLSVHARLLLVEVMTYYRPKKPNLFALSNARAARMLGCAENTAAKAIHQLAEVGWLVIERPGAAKGKRGARERMVSIGIYATETRAEDRDRMKGWEPPIVTKKIPTPQIVSANGSKCQREAAEKAIPAIEADCVTRLAS